MKSWQTVHKTVGKKYLVLPARFRSANLMDTLLSHEAITVKGHNWRCRSHDKANKPGVVRPEFVHTTYIHTISNILFNCHKVFFFERHPVFSMGIEIKCEDGRLVTWICHTDQQKAVCFEMDSCVGCATHIATLLTMDNGHVCPQNFTNGNF